MRNGQPLQFHALFRPEPEGGFTVIVPSLPGCVTYGKTLKEANDMALDAAQGYLASLAKHRGKVISDEGDFIGTISVPQVSSENLKSPAYA